LVRRTGSGVPYRLFALSNFGSMLALVSFPFLVEPTLATRQQAFWWSGGYVVFALMCAFTAWVSRAASADYSNHAAEAESGERPSFGQMLFWVLLAACASTLLVSVTNHMSQNVAPIPLLWVLPLALYLLTFICAFESDRIYRRWLFIPLLAPALAGMAYMIYAAEGNYNIKYAIPGFAIGLFICCLFCHGELARRRPAPRHLTLFYLMVSVGGALGGIFVALVAPRVFSVYWELPLGMIACGALAMVAVWGLRMPLIGPWPLRALILIAVAMLAGYFIRQERRLAKNLVLQARNFYGPLEVRDDLPTQDYAQRTLLHGTIDHGSQLQDPVLRYVTTSYYARRSGVGRAMLALQAKGPVRAGFIGLGAGVLSNYGRKGDYFRIYEINPLVERIAQTLFTFYKHSDADKAILMGDARLTLERQLANEGPQNYDILAVDAFSSDAIPVHLLTREAIQLYFRHLKPEGVLALHISNRYLDLKPVCEGGAASVGRQAWVVEDEGDEASYLSSSTWVLVTSDLSLYKEQHFRDATISQYTAKKGFRPWTDDYSNLFQILDVK
jgi:hypothetical protein